VGANILAFAYFLLQKGLFGATRLTHLVGADSDRGKLKII
jgi:hypothetical protein